MPHPTPRHATAREATLAHVATLALPPLPPTQTWGVFEDLDGHLAKTLGAHGATLCAFSRWSSGTRKGQTAPQASGFDGVTLRLQRDKGALEMSLHLAAHRLPEGAPLYLYGHNDEGIKSAPRHMEALFSSVSTVLTKHHCRVFVGWRNEQPAKGGLAAWRSEGPHPLGGKAPWVSYPGVFAKGGLDEGTRMLIKALPEDLGGEGVLDFACGTGLIAWAVRARGARQVWMSEADAVAMAAARENVPGATGWVSDGWATLPLDQADRIVSNPPVHRGKLQDLGALMELVGRGHKALRPGGVLQCVVQQRIAVEEELRAQFAEVTIVTQDARFCVYQATKGA